MTAIKSRTEHTTPLDPESKEAGETYKSAIIEYDQRGNIISFVSYNSDESIESRILTKFDEKNNVIEEHNYSENNEFIDKSVYTRKQNGKIKKIEIFYPDDNSTIKNYNWYEDELKLEIETADSDGDLESTEIIKLENNNPVEKLLIDYEGKFAEKIVYKYDEKNNMIHKLELDKKDKVIIQDKLFYDENNNVINTHKLNRKNRLLEKTSFEYDKNGNPLTQNFNDQYIIRIEYDEKGNPIKEERQNMHGLIEHEGHYHYNAEGLIIEEKNLFEIKKYTYEFY